MDRRTALISVAGLVVGPQAFAGQSPYNPYNPALEYRILDLASVREVIVRLPKGNITVSTDEIWNALQPTK